MEIKNNFFLLNLDLLIVNWGSRIRTYEWRSQSPQPYHLATPQNFSKNNSNLHFKLQIKCRSIGQEGIRTPDTVVRSHVL